MALSSPADGISRTIAPASTPRAPAATAVPGRLLVLGAALGLALVAISLTLTLRPIFVTPIGDDRSAESLRPLVGAPTSEPAAVVYVASSAAEAAALQDYVTQALIRRELPPGSRVVVAAGSA